MLMNQHDERWGSLLLGESIYYINQRGCTITELADCLGVTPDVVNKKLNDLPVDAAGNTGFAKDTTGQRSWVIWSKIAEAFPGVQVRREWSYNNDDVLASLAVGAKVIVEVDAAPIGAPGGKHWVRFLGDHKCNDPWTGTERPTGDFPNPTGYAVITGEYEEKQVAEATAEPVAAGEVMDEYSGLNLADVESAKVTAHAWKDIQDGKYLKTEDVHAFLSRVCEALGIESTMDYDTIVEKVRESKAQPVENVEVEKPAGEVVVPVNLQNLPVEEKQKVTSLFENFKKELHTLFDL